MDRNEAIADLAERLSILSLDDDDFDFEFVVDQLAGLKTTISGLEESAPSEPWLSEWLSSEHLKGAVLYVGAITNYRKQVSDGRKPPFDPETRSAIVDRFNRWTAQMLARISAYESSRRDNASVAEWLVGLKAFHADPVHNDK